MKYSFVVPIYNDAELANTFCLEFQEAFQSFLKTDTIKDVVELIFVNDGSPNLNAMIVLGDISANYKFVKIVELSRNFGQHIALSAGYANSAGEYVGMLNVDRQDPPSELIKLIVEIEKGENDVVYGLVEKRETGFFNKLTSRWFNKTLNFLTQSKVPLNVATIRIMNRKFVNAYNSLTEKSRYLPGLENWIGFSKGYVSTLHQARKEGKSSYNFKKRVAMAVESIVSFSDFP